MSQLKVKESHQLGQKLQTAYRHIHEMAIANYGCREWARLRGIIDGLEYALGMGEKD